MKKSSVNMSACQFHHWPWNEAVPEWLLKIIHESEKKVAKSAQLGRVLHVYSVPYTTRLMLS